MSINYWFSADSHFFHKNILKYSPDTRHSATLEDMHRDIIQKWNSQVQKGDRVYILGDFCFGGVKKWIEILEQLNFKPDLVTGNHDGAAKSGEIMKHFNSINQYVFKKIEGQAVAMFHFPIIEWENMHYGSFHLFGHAHQAYKTIGGKSMNVGVDTRDDYGLYSWEEVCEFMVDKPVLKRAEFNNVRQVEK